MASRGGIRSTRYTDTGVFGVTTVASSTTAVIAVLRVVADDGWLAIAVVAIACAVVDAVWNSAAMVAVEEG